MKTLIYRTPNFCKRDPLPEPLEELFRGMLSQSDHSRGSPLGCSVSNVTLNLLVVIIGINIRWTNPFGYRGRVGIRKKEKRLVNYMPEMRWKFP